MRQVLIAAAALAVGGILVTSVAKAQTYVAGGPVRVGNMCLVDTDGMGNASYGYYAPCAQQAQASVRRHRR